MFDVFETFNILLWVGVAIVLGLLFLALLGQARYAWRRKDIGLIALMFGGPLLALLVFKLTVLTAFDAPLLAISSIRTPSGFSWMPGYIYGTLIVALWIMLIIGFFAGMGYMISGTVGSTKYTIPTFFERIVSLVFFVIYGWFFGAVVVGISMHH